MVMMTSYLPSLSLSGSMSLRRETQEIWVHRRRDRKVSVAWLSVWTYSNEKPSILQRNTNTNQFLSSRLKRNVIYNVSLSIAVFIDEHVLVGGGDSGTGIPAGVCGVGLFHWYLYISSFFIFTFAHFILCVLFSFTLVTLFYHPPSSYW